MAKLCATRNKFLRRIQESAVAHLTIQDEVVALCKRTPLETLRFSARNKAQGVILGSWAKQNIYTPNVGIRAVTAQQKKIASLERVRGLCLIGLRISITAQSLKKKYFYA